MATFQSSLFPRLYTYTLPPRLAQARSVPPAVRISAALSEAYPLAMPPRSMAQPSSSVASRPSRWMCWLPTSGSSASISSWVGTCGSSDVMPHSDTSGAMVTSNAPSVSSLYVSAAASSDAVSSSSRAPPSVFRRLTLLVSMVRLRAFSSRLISRDTAFTVSSVSPPSAVMVI